jgi:hypothetical protein
MSTLKPLRACAVAEGAPDALGRGGHWKIGGAERNERIKDRVHYCWRTGDGASLAGTFGAARMIARREQKAAERWNHFVHIVILNLFACTPYDKRPGSGGKHYDAEGDAGDEPAADRGSGAPTCPPRMTMV